MVGPALGLLDLRTTSPTRPPAASQHLLAAPLHEPPAHFLPPPLRPWQHFLCKTGQPQALAGSALPPLPGQPSPDSHGGR